MKMKCVLAFVCLLNVFCFDALAAPAAIADLSKLTMTADGIVVGEVVTATASGGSANVLLLIHRVIKGKFRLDSSIEVTAFDLDVNAGVGETKGKHGIWFLRRTGDRWIVLPPTIGRLPLLFSFIAASSISPSLGTVTSPEDGLLIELVAALSLDSGGNSAEVFLTMGAIGSLSANGLKLGETLFTSQNDRERRLGVAMLLRSSSKQAAAKLADLANIEIQADTQNTMARSLCQYRAVSATDIADVGKLSSHVYPPAIRRCAIYSLRSVHSEASLPFLKMSLDDTEASTRYDAIFGIAAFALKMPMQTGVPVFPAPDSSEEFLRHFPSYDAFSKDEPFYVDYWKSWLAKRN